MTDPLSSALEKLDRWSEYAIGQRNRAEASKLSEHYADEEHHMTRAIAIEAVVSDLRASLAAAVERAERAERERDEWRHRCGCTPECELHCCSQDCDNAGAEEASWRGAWDLLDEARAALSSALSRAERAESRISLLQRDKEQSDRDWHAMLLLVATAAGEDDPESAAEDDYDPWAAIRAMGERISAAEARATALEGAAAALLEETGGDYRAPSIGALDRLARALSSPPPTKKEDADG